MVIKGTVPQKSLKRKLLSQCAERSMASGLWALCYLTNIRSNLYFRLPLKCFFEKVYLSKADTANLLTLLCLHWRHTLSIREYVRNRRKSGLTLTPNKYQDITETWILFEKLKSHLLPELWKYLDFSSLSCRWGTSVAARKLQKWIWKIPFSKDLWKNSNVL